jgi:hypothetical protein
VSYEVPLREIEACFQGVIPAFMATVSADGIPNHTYLSIVHRIDDEHVGLTRQFFNKTIANLQATQRAQVDLIHPVSGQTFRLDLLFDHTETEGEMFDRVRARLDVIASLTGMTGIFKLAAVDVCRVLACRGLVGDVDFEAPQRQVVDMVAVDAVSRRIGAANNMDELFSITMQALAEEFGFVHTSLLLVNESGDRLYTVASYGFEEEGIGSEVCFGEGLVGIAAERNRLINLANLPADLNYSQAVRSSFQREGEVTDFEDEIALPGLVDAVSQMAVPLTSRNQVLGVLLLQSPYPSRFQSSDEALMNLLGREIASGIALLRTDQPGRSFVAEVSSEATAKPAIQVKHYAADDSVFIDNDYVIKGVAGRILWRLLQSYSEERRVDFSNKEIRLDPSLDLPDIKDNLEARLILLRRRLEGRDDGFIRIETAGRGRFRLNVARDFSLREVSE